MNQYKKDLKRYDAFYKLIEYFYYNLKDLDEKKIFKEATYTEEEKKGYSFLVHATGKKYLDLDWICLYTKEELSFKENYELVEGMHIMPYRIEEEDIIIDLFKNYRTDLFPDIDDISGNVHKESYGDLQFVLLGKDTIYTGPGTIQVSDDFNHLKSQVKSHFYYPPIFKEDLEALSENEKENIHKMDVDYEKYIKGEISLEEMIESLMIVYKDFEKRFF